MYICVCAAVTDREIRATVANGAETLDDLRIDLGVALRCGSCACAAEELICDTKARLSCRENQQVGRTAAPLAGQTPRPIQWSVAPVSRADSIDLGRGNRRWNEVQRECDRNLESAAY